MVGCGDVRPNQPNLGMIDLIIIGSIGCPLLAL